MDFTSAAKADPAMKAPARAASTLRLIKLFIWFSRCLVTGDVLSNDRQDFAHLLALKASPVLSSLLLSAAAAIAIVHPAAAGKTVGTQGLVSVPVEVLNSGTAAILCQAEIAHWFGTDLASIEPGGRASLDLRFDTLSGTWATMNARGEALPVERAWCGLKGRTYETRWDLTLGRDKPQARQISCREEGAGLDCR
jgi:hypothetical protein